jgi:N-acetylglucosamine kinase-like BadF-type ATPase
VTLSNGLLLGVDGGATKTVALVAGVDGTVLGAGRAGSSDIHGASGPQAAITRVAQAVRHAAREAGVAAADVPGPVFCLCGADWPEDDDFYGERLGELLGLSERPAILNDSFATLRAGTPDGVGMALVLGTGGAIAARGLGGATWFSGFRIASSGAEELGRQVYERLIRGEYGPGPMPTFRSAALEAFGLASVEELVHAISRVNTSRQEALARLAPVLLEAGCRGDPESRALVMEHGRMLAGYVSAAAARVGLPATGCRVVLAGGVLRHPCRDLVDAITEGLPGFAISRATVEPVYGALLLAADAAGVAPRLERLRASGPGEDFFRTL